LADFTPQLLDRVHRQEYGQLLATLIGWLGDFELAEEALQDAFLAAMEHWPREGVPHKPGAWLTTTARRKAIDRLRRSRSHAVEPEQLERLPPAQLAVTEDFDDVDEIPDERLKLIFTCCHPALPLEQQIALTLHTLGGLTTAEIAALSWCRRRRWRSGWCAPSAKSKTPASRTTCRLRTCWPSDWTRCCPSCT
jgi:RNA polymerase sigma-70 factor (ECF subfamily)